MLTPVNPYVTQTLYDAQPRVAREPKPALSPAPSAAEVTTDERSAFAREFPDAAATLRAHRLFQRTAGVQKHESPAGMLIDSRV